MATPALRDKGNDQKITKSTKYICPLKTEIRFHRTFCPCLPCSNLIQKKISENSFSVAYPGCPSRIRTQILSVPDPDPHQRISVFLLKNCFSSSRKYDPGYASRIRILIFFYLSRIQRSKRHRIRNTKFLIGNLE